MLAVDVTRVILNVGPCECHAVRTTHAHHRDFPELHAEGETESDAVSNLKNLLVRSLDSATSGFRREAIEHAIADVSGYAVQTH